MKDERSFVEGKEKWSIRNEILNDNRNGLIFKKRTDWCVDKQMFLSEVCLYLCAASSEGVMIKQTEKESRGCRVTRGRDTGTVQGEKSSNDRSLLLTELVSVSY